MANEEKVISKKRQQTAARIIAAIEDSKGLLTLAARKAGISYVTVWRYTQEFPSVAQAVHEAKETMTDFAEGKLYEQMKEGNIAAIIFYLKTQGKKRGYIERQEITGSDGKPMVTNITVTSENAKKLTDEIVKGEGT